MHIVDATKGPLVGPGRLSRIMPFAATAVISMAAAVPTTSWRPGLAATGCLLMAAVIASSVALPWQRVPRAAQLVPPFGFLVSVLVLMDASGQVAQSPLASLLVLPLMWLAIYEHRLAVLVAAGLTGAALWVALQGTVAVPVDDGALFVFVLVVCCAGMGITLHGLVADARQLALSLREHHLALEHLSLHDPLTDVSNRRGFAAGSRRAADRARTGGSPFSLLYIDIDDFKGLNDTCGHDVGDLLLQEVAERLRGLVRASDTVARLGGDEFAVLVEGVDPGQAAELAVRIDAALRVRYLAAPGVAISASVGVAHSADAGIEPEVVLSAADVSMFERKRRRHGTPAGGNR